MQRNNIIVIVRDENKSRRLSNARMTFGVIKKKNNRYTEKRNLREICSRCASFSQMIKICLS